MQPGFALLFRPFLPVLLALLCVLPVYAWDGDWTQAESGSNWMPDPENTDGVGNIKDRPQKFWIPTPRHHKDVDPEEISDYHGKHTSPYALARFPYNVRYQDWRIGKGYYLVKPGDDSDGSPAVHLVAAQPTDQSLQPLQDVDPSDGSTGQNASDKGPVFRTFMLKKLGRVIAVLPIEGSEAYARKKGEKWPKDALAWVEMEDSQPVLKFYYDKRVYRTRLNPDF